jgi:hypothetical protein
MAGVISDITHLIITIANRVTNNVVRSAYCNNPPGVITYVQKKLQTYACNTSITVLSEKYNQNSVFAADMCLLVLPAHHHSRIMMSPRSLSWSVLPPGNDMDTQLIVVCVAFILPNKIQIYFRVHSRKIKPRPPASGGGC